MLLTRPVTITSHQFTTEWWYRAEMLRSMDSFRRDLKTFLFHSVYGHQYTDWLCDVPSVF